MCTRSFAQFFNNKLGIALIIATILGLLGFYQRYDTSTLTLKMKAGSKGHGQIYWGDKEFDETNSIKFSVNATDDFKEYVVFLPNSKLGKIRIDPIDTAGHFDIKSISLANKYTGYNSSGEQLHHDLSALQNVEKDDATSDVYSGNATSNDPSLLFDAPTDELEKPLSARIKSSATIGIIALAVLIFLNSLDRILESKVVTNNKAFFANNLSLLVACGWVIAILLTKQNIISLPYHWDELGAYVEPSHWLTEGSLIRAFPGFHPPHTFFGHPFGLYLTLSVLYRIFGESIIVTHLFVLFIAAAGMYYTFLLGKLLYNSTVGIISSILLFLSPLFFAQSGMLNGDTVITTLGVITVYYFLSNNYFKYLIAACFLVLTKEASIAFIVAILIYLIITKRRDPDLLSCLLKHSIPLFIITIFFAAQKIITGQFLPNAYFEGNDFAVSTTTALFNKFISVSSWAFFTQDKLYLTIAILLAFLFRRQVAKKELLLFLLIFCIFIFAYSYIYFLGRYIMPIYPYLFIIAAASIYLLFSYKRIYLIAVLLISFSFENKIYAHGAGLGSNELDMQYKDVVMTHFDACTYLETNFSTKKILTNFPLQAALTRPHLGYVTKSLTATKSTNEPYDIIVYSPQSDIESGIKLCKIISDEQLVLVKGFYRNGKSTEIYCRK